MRREVSMLLDKQAKLVMIGDSVTDCGRARPYGEGMSGSLGTGYVSLVDGYLQVNHPEKSIRVINTGISGNTVRDLAERWQTDVLDLQPDWLSIMIGVNDVWRQFDCPHMTEIHVLPDEYRQTLNRLADKTRPQLKGLVIMSPYIMEPNKNDPMRQTMDLYGQICRDAAIEYDAIFVDTQAGFDQLFKHYHPYVVAWDRIHPNHIGAALLSQLFLRSVGA